MDIGGYDWISIDSGYDWILNSPGTCNFKQAVLFPVELSAISDGKNAISLVKNHPNTTWPSGSR